jgi:polyphosphate kinase 2 (PPK2 family)
MKERKTDPSRPIEKLKRKIYERELARLHVELVLLQRWIVDKGLKVCVVFEGRDGAGKGGTIKAITEREARIKRWAKDVETLTNGPRVLSSMA